MSLNSNFPSYGSTWVRRLYCMRCGEGAVSRLPGDGFVTIHVNTHNLDRENLEGEFVVVDRGEDTSISLPSNLMNLLLNEEIIWPEGWREKVDDYVVTALVSPTKLGVE